jgi:signal peptidase I
MRKAAGVLLVVFGALTLLVNAYSLVLIASGGALGLVTGRGFVEVGLEPSAFLLGLSAFGLAIGVAEGASGIGVLRGSAWWRMVGLAVAVLGAAVALWNAFVGVPIQLVMVFVWGLVFAFLVATGREFPPSGPAAEAIPSPASAAPRARRLWLIGGLAAVVVLAGVAVGAWYTLRRPTISFVMPSASMSPTIQAGRTMVVDTEARTPKPGTIIVFELEDGTRDAKRVIALGGDTIEARDGVLRIDGARVAESYLNPGTDTGDFGPLVVPSAHVFVLGDNRANSRDSRILGPVSVEDIVGSFVPPND